jgi:hypothetical protein
LYTKGQHATSRPPKPLWPVLVIRRVVGRCNTQLLGFIFVYCCLFFRVTLKKHYQILVVSTVEITEYQAVVSWNIPIKGLYSVTQEVRSMFSGMIVSVIVGGKIKLIFICVCFWMVTELGLFELPDLTPLKFCF